jgi:hypothetical protein
LILRCQPMCVCLPLGIDRLGGTLQIPPVTFAQVVIATSDAVVLGSQLDAVDLFRPIADMYVSAIKLS